MTLKSAVAIALLLSMMFNAGMQVHPSDLLAVVKNVSLLLRALLANFVVVPLAAYAVVTLLRIDGDIATGILLMAIAPGVPFVILAGGRAKGGSHELAATLALILPALSLITIPITAQLVLPAADRVDVPPAQLVSLLAFQVLPLFAGMLVAWKLPAAAQRLTPWFGRLTVVALVALLAILAPAIFKSTIRVFGSRGIFAVMLIEAAALGAGWLLGGPKKDERFTLAIGTALRNPATAMVIASADFTAPAVSAGVVAFFLVQAIGAAVFGWKKNAR